MKVNWWTSQVNWHLLQLFCLLLIPWDLGIVQAKPVKGVTRCLNNEDCLGTHRKCHRNATMAEGVCTCKPGYRLAQADIIKCLSIQEGECHSDLDCPSNSPCGEYFQPSSWESSLDELPFSFHTRKKRCLYLNGLDHGLRQDFLDNLLHTAANHRAAGFHVEYIKFVEDAMLVLFLICILTTLLIVHRATCYRQFRQARRHGPLRFFIPNRDDQPPPYGNYGTREDSIDEEDEGPPLRAANVAPGMAIRLQGIQAKRQDDRESETPPPTYDEALMISQALSASHAEAQAQARHSHSLYISLPDCSSSSSIVTDNSQESGGSQQPLVVQPDEVRPADSLKKSDDQNAKEGSTL